MTTELHQKDSTTRPTERRYSSVKDLLQGEDIPKEVQNKLNEYESDTRFVQLLTEMRVRANLTQQQMGEMLGVTQSQVSKIEHGRDEELTIHTMRIYAEATKGRIGVMIGKPLTHVESIKAHALGMRHHMLALAKMANEHEEMEKDIRAFFGESFFNILDILIGCGEQLPKNNASQVKAQLIDCKMSMQSPSSAKTHGGLMAV